MQRAERGEADAGGGGSTSFNAQLQRQIDVVKYEFHCFTCWMLQLLITTIKYTELHANLQSFTSTFTYLTVNESKATWFVSSSLYYEHIVIKDPIRHKCN